MSNEEVDKALLEYRVGKLEDNEGVVSETLKTISANVVESNKEQALQKQRLLYLAGILTVALNIAIFVGQTIFKDSYSEKDKKEYYDKRVTESEIIQKLRKRIEELER